MKLTERIKKIPPYIFAEIDKKKAEAQAKGIDIIDLGIGDPDLPTPQFIVDKMKEQVDNAANHNYPPYQGTADFRKAVAEWYQKRFGVTLDSEKQVLSLIGSKEGIAHAFFTFLDPNDVAILPDPGYPAYKVAALIAGGVPYQVPVFEENNYEMDLDSIPQDILDRANMLFVNYPNNPTGAVARDEYLQTLIEFGKKNDVLICMDNAYSEVYYDGYKPKSILEFDGAMDTAIEFHTLSKSYNMTGWRIGMAVGNEEAIQALGKIKTNVDSGIFKAIQEAGAEALRNGDQFIEEQNKIYQERRDIIVKGLKELGWNVSTPKASFYIWAKTPNGMKSQDFTIELLEKTGVLVVPGTGYGENGEGYFRISITTETENLSKAIDRFKQHNIRYEAAKENVNS